jgi:hypothetical protein
VSDQPQCDLPVRSGNGDEHDTIVAAGSLVLPRGLIPTSDRDRLL